MKVCDYEMCAYPSPVKSNLAVILGHEDICCGYGDDDLMMGSKWWQYSFLLSWQVHLLILTYFKTEREQMNIPGTSNM